jgi:hypothetical protein
MQGHFMTVIIPSASFSIILKQCHSKIYLPQQKELPVLHFIRRGERVLCSLATVLSCIDPSVRIVTKYPKVGPLLIFSISLVCM